MGEADLELHLIDTGVATGQIELDDLAKIARSMQELTTRLGRHVIDQRGPGRTKGAAAAATRLRLIKLGEGSTVLRIAYGPEGTLPLDGGVDNETATLFWEIVRGIEAARRPDWVTSLIADATSDFLDSVNAAAGSVVIQQGPDRTATWERRSVDRGVWQPPDSDTSERIAVEGTLRAVDLQSHIFRIIDDAGNRVRLTDVVDDATVAANLIDKRTRATGTAVRDESGALLSVASPVLSPAAFPPGWTTRQQVDLETLVRMAPGPVPLGENGLSDTEFEAFTAALDDL